MLTSCRQAAGVAALRAYTWDDMAAEFVATLSEGDR